MQDNQELLQKLRQLLSWKKSKAFYASKLSISESEVEDLIKELRLEECKDDLDNEVDNYLHCESLKEVNNDKGTLKSTVVSSFDPKNHEELAKLHKVDTSIYKISSYWSKQRGDKFTSSILCSMIKGETPEKFQAEFKDFLKTFKPSSTKRKTREETFLPKVLLVLPKQDAHYNKFDIYGDNSIEDRFYREYDSTLNMLEKACATNTLDDVLYIVGSDQFNSEWTSMTTKGTPQQNILSYQDAFKAICEHEISIIDLLLEHSNNVKVAFLPGNHDEYVGWHLVNWLSSYYRNNDDIVIHTETVNTKYYKYGNSAILLNHGDAIKPKELAHKFPIGFKEEWSNCDNYYIFTGDKHVELSMDIHGIKFYQVPQLSSATSKWDDKQGYIDSKAEMTAFVITESNGMSDIYKNLM